MLSVQEFFIYKKSAGIIGQMKQNHVVVLIISKINLQKNDLFALIFIFF
jgi:hypothetical protein